jgi:hypothetical protein
MTTLATRRPPGCFARIKRQRMARKYPRMSLVTDLLLSRCSNQWI